MKTNKNKNYIDHFFSQKLQEHELSGKGESWYLIQKLIEENKREKVILKRKWFTGIFTTIIFILTIWYFIPNSITENPQTDNSETQQLNSFLNRQEIKSGDLKESVHLHEEQFNISSPLQNQQVAIGKIEKTEETSSLNSLLQSSSEAITTYIMNTESIDSEILAQGLDYLTSSSSVRYIYYNNDSVQINIDNMGDLVNSPYPDYAPVINADGTVMYFTSRRPLTEKEIKKGRISQEYIYVSRYDTKKKQWSKAEALPEPVNVPGRFNSIIALSADGQRMLIYRDDKFGNGDIYESVLRGNTWSEPQKLPEPINSQYHEPSATFSPDGQTIYFISNRPGGKGKKDIWYCTKNENGEWGEAKNLGAPVNSPEDEEGLFMHPDGRTLYFSSRGHNTMGGYDIFYTVYDGEKWSVPQNLGTGINTAGDDVYFVMEANGKIGYYSSDRKDSKGEKDIYKIEFIKNEKDKGPLLTLFKGQVLDKETQQPLEANIEITDLEKGKKISTLTSNAVSGEFLISLPSGKNYGINVQKEGYLFFSENMNIPADASYNEIVKTVLLSKLKKESKIILKNIFYDYDKATLRPESITELNRLYDLLVQNPRLKVELSAHTDSRGSDAYNNDLSQRRAQSCVDYLVKKGIDKDRIIAKGYGKQQLLIKDAEIENLKTEKEKEEAHQKNRRTEIKILEY